MSVEAISIIVTIVLALVGYFATHVNALRLSKRKEQLELVEKRINDFYVPLYVTSLVGITAYQTLLT